MNDQRLLQWLWFAEVMGVGANTLPALSLYGSPGALLAAREYEDLSPIAGRAQRSRLHALEPEQMDEAVIARMAKQEKLCPQFHLSLQSGCDDTLRRMNRHYDTAEYRRIVANLRAAFANAAITTDIMVGFPGESKQEFELSLAFAQEIGFAKAHVFAYSPRPGTAAANRPGQVPNAVKEERSRRMIAAMDEVRSAFLLSQLGRTEEVLVETTHSPLGYEGFTKNYTPVYLDCAEKLCGTICKMRLEAVLDGHCVGTLVP